MASKPSVAVGKSGRDNPRRLTERGMEVIAEALRRYPYPLTADGIAEEIGFPESSTRCLISQMLKQDLIETCDPITVWSKGSPQTYLCYRLKP